MGNQRGVVEVEKVGWMGGRGRGGWRRGTVGPRRRSEGWGQGGGDGLALTSC